MQTVCKFRVFYRFLGQNRYLHLHLALYLHKTFVSICFQRLIVSIISSTDEDSDVGLKDSQSLVTVISLLAQHLEPDGQQVIPYSCSSWLNFEKR